MMRVHKMADDISSSRGHMMKKHIAGLALAGICTLFAANAYAETVAVMKLDSNGRNTDGQAELLLEALRDQVSNSDNLTLDSNGGDITYTEMQMVTGCDKNASIACYDAACETLGAPAIIFGSVEEGGNTHLVWYVSGKGIFREVTGEVTDVASANKLAKSIVVGEVGNLIVTSNVPGADVFIDGKRIGMSAEFEESATPFELPTGSYVVAVHKEGFTKEDAVKVSIEPNKTAKVHVSMMVATDVKAIRRGIIIGGYVAGGVGLAALATGIALEFVADNKNDEMNKTILQHKTSEAGQDATSIRDKWKPIKNTYSKVLWGVGAGLTAIGVSMVIFGYVYDFTGEKVERRLSNSWMPDLDMTLTPDYKGMSMGWTF